jgi:hypothetical protein
MPGKPLDLDAIQQRADAAVEGPWEEIALGSEGYTIRPSMVEMRMRARVAMCGYREWEEDKADAIFIAHARTDVPALVAELRAARDLLADKDDLLVCYRLGEHPSEALLRRLDQHRAAYDKATEETSQ